MNEQALITVAILDSNHAILEGYKRIISKYSNFEVIHSATSGEALFDKLKKFPVDVVLSDLETEDWDVLKFLRETKKLTQPPKIVVNAAFHPGPLVKLILKRGIGSYILKNRTDLDRLPDILKEVHCNGLSLSSVVTSKVVKELEHETHATVNVDKVISQREWEVLACLCNGFNYQEIANDLCITISTVKFHVGNLVFKTSSRNYFDLTLKAIKNQWVSDSGHNFAGHAPST